MLRVTLMGLGVVGLGALAAGCSSGGANTTGSGGISGDDSGTDAGTAVPPAGVVASGVRWFGRVDTSKAAGPRFSWSGTGFIAQLSGTGLSVDLSLTNSNEPYLFKPVVDGAPAAGLHRSQWRGDLCPRHRACGRDPHRRALPPDRRGEGDATLTGITVEGGALLDPPAGPARLIEVIGDSITAGYGDLGVLADTDCFPTESDWDSYASVAARAVGAEVSTIAASGRGVIRNYNPGDTVGTMPMLYPLTLANDSAPLWDFHIEPQAVVINLGTNDISDNKGDPGQPFQDGYLALIQTVRGKYPHAYIVCIIGPLLSGADLQTIEGYIQGAVDAANAAGDARVEFFDQIAPQPTTAAACQYHPNVAEQTVIGNQLAAELQAKLGW